MKERGKDCDMLSPEGSCKGAYEIMNIEAPCWKCKKELLPLNEESLFVYGMLCNQVITAGMGEPIALNFNAIDFILTMYDVRDRRGTFEKVLKIFEIFNKRE